MAKLLTGESFKLDSAVNDKEVESREATIPTINQPAPDFTTPTTQGEISLSDYRGQWVMLFSHPSDLAHVSYVIKKLPLINHLYYSIFAAYSYFLNYRK
ncbi:AhpC/TSA family protein [Orenia metallireducens]|uniref:AhpC/TSA family protein n=1 Tax=Orenia metallireducens TaxID=1413210 RepID=A0A285G6D4_9FIRM|nr:redoxin domain-containing protein [Orenia metallireducens]SNY19142.1 AhpC/TSA family protein [Orenia metallireducens]